MKDGRLTLKIKEGRISSVAVGSDLCESFCRLFEVAETDLNAEESSIDSGVRAVLFGCMWIEGLCNEYLLQLLELYDLPDGASEALWAALERTSTLHKLRILAAFGAADKQGDDAWVGEMNAVLQLRNSLAHFKERDVEVCGPITLEELEPRLKGLHDSFPETQLISQLKPPVIQRSVASIRQTVARLEEILHQHVRVERTRTDETATT
jgi:hypothetical protein